jgi:hypothetical protein
MTVLRLFLVVALLGPSVAIADELRVRNDSAAPAALWLWSQRENRWVEPHLVIPARQSGVVQFQAGEHYWMTVRDSKGQEIPLGWIDIGEKKVDPKVELCLTEIVEKQVSTKPTWSQRLGQKAGISQGRTYVKIHPVWKAP